MREPKIDKIISCVVHKSNGLYCIVLRIETNKRDFRIFPKYCYVSASTNWYININVAKHFYELKMSDYGVLIQYAP